MPVRRKGLEQFRPNFITMKKAFLSLVAFVFATVCFAQQTLVATLTHGEEVTMFYGTYAYRDAMAAAVDGDVINLSGGGFQACTINKAVSIRGTGVDAAQPTFIINDFDINIPAETTGRLTMEGLRVSNTMYIRGTLTNAYFLNNIIAEYYTSKNSIAKNSIFVNCNVQGFYVTYGTSQAQFLNSYIGWYYTNGNSAATACFVNCVIRPDEGYRANDILNSTLINSCLVFTTSNSYTSFALPSSTSATNCVAIGCGTNAFGNLKASINNKSVADMSFFVDSDYMNDLTDEAKATYLGTDGTPVGMYGGPMPYDLTPTYPQITKMNVASKTTADGKLSVDIEVSAAK